MSNDPPGIDVLHESDTYTWRGSDILGRGSIGKVFKGHNKKTGEEVAIKTFNGTGLSTLPYGQHILAHEREFAILKTLDHPNIIKFIAAEYELGRNSNPASLVIVMELATEGSLKSEIEKPENRFGFDDMKFLRLLSHLVSGLSYLRQNHNIIHRDLKPLNILKTVTNDGQILYKLCDFGTAKVVEEGEGFRTIVGTEAYFHPDIYTRFLFGEGPSHFENNCDLWSVGVTLYQAATGVLPFRPDGGQRLNRLEMFEMITKKPSNAISGVQSSHGGPVEYSEELPRTCRLSICLRPRIQKILVALFQLDKTKQWPWDQFFRECKHVIRAGQYNDRTLSRSILLIGGMDKACDMLNTIDIYDPDISTVDQQFKCHLKIPRYDHISLLHKGTLYIVGGKDEKSTSRSVEMIDPIKQQWIKYGPEMKKERDTFAGVAMDDQLMVFGGRGLCSCEVLDTTTLSWSPLPDMKDTRSGHNAIEYNGNIYIIGGFVNDFSTIDVTIFNPTNSSWIPGPSMNQERARASAAKFDSGIVVSGGMLSGGSCEKLDTREKVWMKIGSMKEERLSHTLINYNGRLLAMGGMDEDTMWYNTLSTVEEYEPRMDKWNYIKSLTSGHDCFAAVVIP